MSGWRWVGLLVTLSESPKTTSNKFPLLRARSRCMCGGVPGMSGDGKGGASSEDCRIGEDVRSVPGIERDVSE